MMVHLIETYCRSEFKRLKEDNQLNQLVVELTQRNKRDLKKKINDLLSEAKKVIEKTDQRRSQRRMGTTYDPFIFR